MAAGRPPPRGRFFGSRVFPGNRLTGAASIDPSLPADKPLHRHMTEVWRERCPSGVRTSGKSIGRFHFRSHGRDFTQAAVSTKVQMPTWYGSCRREDRSRGPSGSGLTPTERRKGIAIGRGDFRLGVVSGAANTAFLAQVVECPGRPPGFSDGRLHSTDLRLVAAVSPGPQAHP